MSRIESLESRQMLAGDTYTVTTLSDVAVAGTATDNLWSLREALAHAATDSQADKDVIEFGDLNGEISLALGHLLINSDVEIHGPGAEALTFNAHQASRVIYVAGAGPLNVSISGLTIKGGAAGDGAGIYNASENLTLDRVTVTDNHTTAAGTGLGGGLFSANGSVTVIDSTFNENTATRGGALRIQGFPSATLNVYGSAFYQNESSAGEGALSAYSTTSYIENTTISGNKAGYTGGAIMVESVGQMTIVNSTIVENQAVSYGGGIYASGSAAVTLHNTILAKNISVNTTYHDYIGAIAAGSSYNIIGAGVGGQTLGTGNIVGLPSARVDPLISPLGNNGGLTKTHALVAGSPAFDAGSDAVATTYSVTTDQRGNMRTAGVGVIDIGAYELSLVVSTLTDESDGNHSAGDLSLREALLLAGQQSTSNDITFDPSLAGDIDLILGQLPITTNVKLIGPGANRLRIDAQLASRALMISGTGTLDVTLSGLTIARGRIEGDGAGIYNASEKLTLHEVVVTGNEAYGAQGLGGGLFSVGGEVIVNDSMFHGNSATRGGALRTQSGTTLTINRSTLYDNEASAIEGALSAHQTTAYIENSTFSGNSAPSGGAIRTNSTGMMTIVNSTITKNTATGYGGGIQVTGTGTVTLHNTILADNTSSTPDYDDLHGILNPASSYNLIGTGANGQTFTGISNQLGLPYSPIDPKLAPLGDNNGPTKTHAPLVDSPALDMGTDVYATTIDQRGHRRSMDLAGVGNGGTNVSDIGAFEAGNPTVLTVMVLDDELDPGIVGNGPDLSLREALAYAATTAAIEVIDFDPSLFPSPQILTLIPALGALPITAGMVINGPGSGQLTINANGASAAISLESAPSFLSGFTAEIRDLSLTGSTTAAIRNFQGNGQALLLENVQIFGNTGRGVDFQMQSALTITNSEIRDNSGTGVYVTFNNNLLIANSTIAGNGRGVEIYQGNGPANIVNTTISGNRSAGNYSGLSIGFAAATVTNSTITNNRADTGNSSGASTATGGVYVYTGGKVTLQNSIVAGNFAGADVNAVAADLGRAIDYWPGVFISTSSHNLIGTGHSGMFSGVTGAGNLIGVAPGLAALNYNGGPTRTHALLPNSPAIDKGKDSLAVSTAASSFPVDQRGFKRIEDNDNNGARNNVDIGAFELLRSVAIGKVGNVLEIDDRASHVDFVTVETAIIGGATRILVNGVALSATTYPAATITGITVLGGDGHDVIDLSRVVPSHLPSVVGTSLIAQGEAGNDTLIGSALNDSLRGGDGDDLLEGRSGGDMVTGGTGDDTYKFAGAATLGTDTLVESAIPGSGIDTLDFSELNFGKGIDINLQSLTNDVISQNGRRLTLQLSNVASIEGVIGTDFDDRIFGNVLENRLLGGRGADTISGGDGDDHIEGDDGNDVLEGQRGDDTIYGGGGDDSMAGGDEIDVIDGGTGADTVHVRAGEDYLNDHVTDPNQVPAFENENQDVNHEPQVRIEADRRLTVGTALSLQLQAYDFDAGQTLTYAPSEPLPTGANLSPSGLLTWTPTTSQSSKMYDFKILVTDDGEPPLQQEMRFGISVDPISEQPMPFVVSVHPYLAFENPPNVHLSWPLVPNADSYRIERRTGGGNWQLVGTETSVGFSDYPAPWGSAPLGVVHEYRVIALNASTELATSPTVKGFIPAHDPSLTFTRLANGTISLQWNQVVPDVEYRLERYSSSGEGWVELGAWTSSTVSYLDTNAIANQQYIYRIYALPTSPHFLTNFERGLSGQVLVPAQPGQLTNPLVLVLTGTQEQSVRQPHGILVPVDPSDATPTYVAVRYYGTASPVTATWSSTKVKLYDTNGEVTSGSVINWNYSLRIKGLAASDEGEIEIVFSAGGVSSTLKATVVETNLTGDSDNDGALSPNDDLAEGNPALPSIWVQSNSRDSDGDGIPAFADGLAGSDTQVGRNDSGASEDFAYSKLKLTRPSVVDLDRAMIRFTGVSDVAPSSTAVGGTYDAANLTMRLWLGHEGNFAQTGDRYRVSRDPGRVDASDDNEVGNWIPGYTWIPIKNIFRGGVETVELLAEGLKLILNSEVRVTIAPFGVGAPEYADSVRFTVMEAGLSIGGASRNQREEITSEAVLVPINDGNADSAPYIEGGTAAQNPDYFQNDPEQPILDMFDGYAHSSIAPDQSGSNKSANFTAATIKLSGMDLTHSLVRLRYDLAMPGSTSSSELSAHDGAMRIWKKNGKSTRNANFSPSGDLIDPDHWYTPAELGLTSWGATSTVYLEGVNPSDAGNFVRLEVKPGDLLSPANRVVASDVVKADVGKYIVSGRINYALYGNEAPARFVKVAMEEIDVDGSVTSLATTYTNASGEFILHSNAPPSPTTKLVVKAYATSDPNANPDGLVKRSASVEFDNTPYSVILDFVNSPPTVEGLRIDATGSKAIGGTELTAGSGEAHAFQTLDALVTGTILHSELQGAVEGHVPLTYLKKEKGASTTPANIYYKAQMELPVDLASDWDTIIHEYGHIVSEEIGFGVGIINAKEHHAGVNVRAVPWTNDAEGLELAFNEGLSNFFSILAQAEIYVPPLNPQHTNTDGPNLTAGGYTFSLQTAGSSSTTPSSHGTGEDEEITIARILWDLYDADADDGVTMTRNSLISHLINNGSDSGLAEFLDYLHSNNVVSQSTLDSIAVGNLAAPDAQRMLINGAKATSYTSGLLGGNVQFEWIMPQAKTYMGGGMTDPPVKGPAFSSSYLAVYNANGVRLALRNLPWTAVSGTALVRSNVSTTTNELMNGLTPGTYSWQIEGSWNGWSNFRSQSITFTVQ